MQTTVVQMVDRDPVFATQAAVQEGEPARHGKA